MSAAMLPDLLVDNGRSRRRGPTPTRAQCDHALRVAGFVQTTQAESVVTADPDPRQLVRFYFEEVLTQRRIDRLDELLDPSFRSYAPSGESIDRHQYQAAVTATLAAFPDLAVTIEEQVAERDLVATRWTATGTHSGALFGIGPTKRRVRVSAMHMHRVRGGRLIEHWEVIDLHGLLAQLTGTEN
jgi:predicted ester cyclase